MPVEARFQGYPIHANNGIPYAVGVRCCVDFVDDGCECVFVYVRVYVLAAWHTVNAQVSGWMWCCWRRLSAVLLLWFAWLSSVDGTCVSARSHRSLNCTRMSWNVCLGFSAVIWQTVFVRAGHRGEKNVVFYYAIGKIVVYLFTPKMMQNHWETFKDDDKNSFYVFWSTSWHWASIEFGVISVYNWCFKNWPLN